MKPRPVDYLGGYPERVREQAHTLHREGRLLPMLQKRYRETHDITDNARLYTYVQDMKRTFMKSSPPLGKVRYCEKISTVHKALGLHTFVAGAGKSSSARTASGGQCVQVVPPTFCT